VYGRNVGDVICFLLTYGGYMLRCAGVLERSFPGVLAGVLVCSSVVGFGLYSKWSEWGGGGLQTRRGLVVHWKLECFSLVGPSLVGELLVCLYYKCFKFDQ